MNDLAEAPAPARKADDRVDLDLGEVPELTFDARALRVAVSPAGSGIFDRMRQFGR